MLAVFKYLTQSRCAKQSSLRLWMDLGNMIETSQFAKLSSNQNPRPMREAFKPVLTTTLWKVILFCDDDTTLGGALKLPRLTRTLWAALTTQNDSLGRLEPPAGRWDVDRAKLSPLRDGFWVHAKRAPAVSPKFVGKMFRIKTTYSVSLKENR